MNLYHILGVRKNAARATVQRAYRRKALEHHPDRGGDRAQFEAVQLAWDVLGDPERRERYDATGETGTGTTDPLHLAALAVLSQALAAVVMARIAKGGKAAETDVVAELRTRLQASKAELDKSIAGQKAAKEFLSQSAPRFGVKDGDNLLADMARSHEAECDKSLAQTLERLRAMDAALVLLKSATFRRDKATMQTSSAVPVFMWTIS